MVSQVSQLGRIGLEIMTPPFVIVGQNYSIFLVGKGTTGKWTFKGGTGGARDLRATLALIPSAFPFISAIAFIMFFAVGYASLAILSIGASTLLLSVIQYLLDLSSWQYIVYGFLSTGLFVLALLPNIVRLISWRLKNYVTSFEKGLSHEKP